MALIDRISEGYALSAHPRSYQHEKTPVQIWLIKLLRPLL